MTICDTKTHRQAGPMQLSASLWAGTAQGQWCRGQAGQAQPEPDFSKREKKKKHAVGMPAAMPAALFAGKRTQSHATLESGGQNLQSHALALTCNRARTRVGDPQPLEGGGSFMLQVPAASGLQLVCRRGQVIHAAHAVHALGGLHSWSLIIMFCQALHSQPTIGCQQCLALNTHEDPCAGPVLDFYPGS